MMDITIELSPDRITLDDLELLETSDKQPLSIARLREFLARITGLEQDVIGKITLRQLYQIMQQVNQVIQTAVPKVNGTS